MRSVLLRRSAGLVCLQALLVAPASANDWPCYGGNPARNGQCDEFGPLAPTLAWTYSRPSQLSRQTFTEGLRAFTVRVTSFPSQGNVSPVVAIDMATGAELWAVDIPANPGDWTAWVGGVRNGQVYASRSGNGASVLAKLYALDAASGEELWSSAASIDASAPEFSFTDDGDLLLCSYTRIWRIRASDGSTAWVAYRQGSVSGNCGGAVFGDALYVADAVAGGQAIKRFDVDTGALLYQSPVMPGYTLQNHPFVGPDGTVYLSRTQGNALTDFCYAFTDTGAGFVQRWRVPATSSADSELAVGRDGSVYIFGANISIQRVDPATGAILNTSQMLADLGASPHIIVDRQGLLFVDNACGFDVYCGQVYSFEPDLTLRWTLPAYYGSHSALGEDGTLIVNTGQSVKAYRTPHAYGAPKVTSQGCSPQIGWSGSKPSASSGSGFVVRCQQVTNQTNGLLVYGLSGESSAPFHGGTMWVAPPRVRTALANSAGSAPPAVDCSGAYALDFNAYVASNQGPPQLHGPGTEVWCQWWGRDPGFAPPGSSLLSAGLRFVIEP